MRFVKKFLIPLLFLAATPLLAPSVDVFAQTFKSVTPNPANIGDNIQFELEKNNSDNLIVVFYVDGKPAKTVDCPVGTGICRNGTTPARGFKVPSGVTYPDITILICDRTSGKPTNEDNCNSSTGKKIKAHTYITVSGITPPPIPGPPTVGPPPGAPSKNPCIDTNGDGKVDTCQTALGDIPTRPQDFAQRVLEIAVGLGGGLALILMVIGAIKVLTSTGDQQKLNAGRDMIVAAVAGLLFIIFSVLILRFIGFNVIFGF